MCAVRELTRLVAPVVRESVQEFTSPPFPSLVRLLLDEGAQSLGNRVCLDDMPDNIFSVGIESRHKRSLPPICVLASRSPKSEVG